MASSPDAPPGARPRTPVFGAFLEGWRRVLRAPVLTVSALAAMFVIALPLAMALRDDIERHLGPSARAEQVAARWDAGWAAEFGAQAQGASRTFTHEILGFGGTLLIMSDLVDNQPLNPQLLLAVAASIAAWMFLTGGFIDRLARGRPVGAGHFFAVSGVFFLRFLRLAAVMGAAYWALFAWLHPYLFGTIYNWLTRDIAEERRGIAIRVVLYVIFGAALALVNLVADFAKVRAVVEDRRSMLGAIDASLRFIRRRFFRVWALYLLNALAFLIVLRLWMASAPSAEAAPWLALLAAQIYLLLRVWAKLAFMASEVVFFQGELAHAHYTAAPEPIWPDSPAVEAIDNLRSD